MILVNVKNISLSFGVRQILEDITFALHEGGRLGIVGANGAGKSSLLKILSGEIRQDYGDVFISGGRSAGVLEQDNSLMDMADVTALGYVYSAFPDLTAAEERLRSLETFMESGADTAGESYIKSAGEYAALYEQYTLDGGLEFRGRCLSALKKMGFSDDDLAKPPSLLSGGQRTRLAMCRLLCREPDILMLDEPTNHLDAETVGWLEDFAASYNPKKCLIAVSHDRYFLDRVTNMTLFVENCRAYLYEGSYTRAAELREADRAAHEKQYELQQREIKRIEGIIKQQRAWGRERNIIAAESREKALARMEKIDRPPPPPKNIRMDFRESSESGEIVLTARGLRMTFGVRTLFSGVSFQIRRGERVFILGPNGSGKSTLLRIIAGILMQSGGVIEYGSRVEPGYYDQDNQNLSGGNTVLGEMWAAFPAMREPDVRAMLGRFLFCGDDVKKTVSVLSGGERGRLSLAKLITSKYNLLLLDEPTNHLDIGSKEALETALAGYDGTLIAVSHDRYLINKLAGRIIEINPAGGDNSSGTAEIIDYYISRTGEAWAEFTEWKKSKSGTPPTNRSGAGSPNPQPPQNESSDQPAAKSGEQKSAKDSYLENKRIQSEQRSRERRRTRLAGEAKQLEQELEKATEELFGSAATDYIRADQLEKQISKIELRLLEIYEEIE